MHPDTPKYLWDVQTALSHIARFTSGKSFEDYASDLMCKSAVERQLEIIGEALNALARKDPEAAAKVPDLPRIVGLRNVLIHGYASVDDELVWGVVTGKLASLQQSISALGADL